MVLRWRASRAELGAPLEIEKKAQVIYDNEITIKIIIININNNKDNNNIYYYFLLLFLLGGKKVVLWAMQNWRIQGNLHMYIN